MYLISNKTNTIILSALMTNFVRPLLSMLVEAAVTKQDLYDTASFNAASTKTQAAIIVAMSVKYMGTSMAELCTRIVQDHTVRELDDVLKHYDKQSSDLASGNYSIKPVDLPDDVCQLFSKYIYEQLFDNELLWSALGLTRLTREHFHENFRVDNDYPSCYPYCDLDTINSRGNYIIEHFLPRAHFPLLAIHPNNLFTACNSCNLAVAGKGMRIVDVVTTPYTDEIGRLIHFRCDNASMRVIISHPPSRDDIKGFLELLQMTERYGKTNTWRQLRGRVDAFVESLSGRNLSPTEIIEYARRFSKGGVLNYALLSWVGQTYT